MLNNFSLPNFTDIYNARTNFYAYLSFLWEGQTMKTNRVFVQTLPIL